MIDIDDLHPKQAKMSKAVLTQVFQAPLRDPVIEYAAQKGDSAFLVLADEIHPFWCFLAKKGVDDRDRARTEAVAERWLALRNYGLGVTVEEYGTPPLSTYCEYPTSN